MKEKIFFAVLMAVVTTGIISFTLLSLNLGWIQGFVWIWMKSWAIAYLVALPLILILSPTVQRLAAYLSREPSAHKT